MTIDLYYANGCKHCRGVLLTAKAVGVELNYKPVNLYKREHRTPEYMKMNPHGTVPTLVDNGFALYESKAIVTYFVSQYGKDDSLYPKDPKKKALVDQRLYFDAGTLYARYADYCYPLYFGNQNSFDPAKLERLMEAFVFFNTFLEGQVYAAGNNLTVADLVLVASVATCDVSGIDFSAYPNVTQWYARVKKTAPCYEEACGKNVLEYKAMIEETMRNKNKSCKM